MEKKAKILVVEDDASSLEFLRILLSHSGYEVAEAEDGVQALRYLKVEKPDLIISDILMPAMDGFELAQKVRTQSHLQKVPILFYSATYHEKQAKWLAQAFGVTDKLEKPADPEVILKAVEKALNSTALPIKADPFLLAEEHTRLLSDKILAKVHELEESHGKLQAEIEERKKTQSILQESEVRYRSLIENLPVGIFIWSLKADRFMAVNPAMAQILGYVSPEEVLRLSVARDVCRFPRDCEEIASRITSERVMTGQEISWKRKDGGHLLARASFRCTSEDLVIEGLAEDITWQRELETQLRQTQKLESLGRLAGGVAHDFNNLLMAIGGYTDLLLVRIEENTTVRKYAEEIKKATQRSAGLTRQLLAFSRKQVAVTASVDLKALLTDLSTMLQHLMGSQIVLSINTPGRELYVEADRNQLEQVIVNLAVNARDAMPKGGTLHLDASDTEITGSGTLPAGRYVCFSVTDTGQGIEKHLQQRVFEPFFSTKGDQGTGLGLATVYGIVKQAKGEILLHSEPGHGTTFTVMLPAASKCAVELQPEPRAEAARGQERILLVDDEEALRLSMQEYLEAKGYTILPARNGGEALEILSKEHGTVEILVTDLKMPGLTGDDLARKIWEHNRNLPVLFISGFMDSPAHEFVSSRPAGSDYLEKPFPLADLAARIRLLLDGFPTPAVIPSKPPTAQYHV